MGANLEPIDFGSGGSTVELDCGKSHTCALLDDGFIKVKSGNILSRRRSGIFKRVDAPVAPGIQFQ